MSEPNPPASAAISDAGQITISLKMFCNLRRYVESDEADIVHVSAPHGCTASGLPRRLGFDPNERVTFGINGVIGSGDTLLQDGDDLMLFRPMQGE